MICLTATRRTRPARGTWRRRHDGGNACRSLLNGIRENIRASGRNPSSMLVGLAAAWIAFFLILFVLPVPSGQSPAGNASEGHIVYESYNDWLVDQREEHRRCGLWSETDVPKTFPIGHPHEEMIMGQRAWRKWKDYLCAKRRYVGKAAL